MIAAHGLLSAISDLRRIQEVLPVAAAQAVDLTNYQDKLIEVARQAINGLKAEGFTKGLPEDWEAMVAALLATIAITGIRHGSIISLGPVPKELADSMAHEVSGIPRLSREAITDWVARYKDLDPTRDQTSEGYYSFKKIARNLVYKILNDPQPWFRTDLPGHGALNPRGLAQFLGLGPVQSDQMSFILISVLQAWKGFAREAMVDRFTDYLNQMMS